MADLNEGRLDLRGSRPRFLAFAIAAAVLFTALGGRLFQLQVVRARSSHAALRRTGPSRSRFRRRAA